jgi:hypothetical protein
MMDAWVRNPVLDGFTGQPDRRDCLRRSIFDTRVNRQLADLPARRYTPPKRPSRKYRRISPGTVPSTSIGHLPMQVDPQCPVRPVATGVVRYNGLCQAASSEWR